MRPTAEVPRGLGTFCQSWRVITVGTGVSAVDNDGEFSAFVVTHWPRLVRAAVLLGCTPAESEDVAQTTLVRCLRHWDKLQTADDTNAYVHRILVNTFLSSRRRHWRKEQATETLPDVPATDEFELVDQTDAVFRALRELPSDQRVAVVLRYYVHLTEVQMSSVLGVPAGTVKSRLARALKTLAANEQLAELRGTP